MMKVVRQSEVGSVPFTINSAAIIIIRVCAVLGDPMGISGLFEEGRPAQTRSLRFAVAL